MLAIRHVSVRHSMRQYRSQAVSGCAASWSAHGSLAAAVLARCVRTHRAPPRTARRSHDARWSDDWRRAIEEDRRRRGFTGLHDSALRHLSPRRLPRAARAVARRSRLGQLSGLLPTVDGLVYASVAAPVLAGPGAKPRIRVRAAVRCWHYASRYWLSQTAQTAWRPSACSS